MENEIFKIYKETRSNRYGCRVYEVSNLGRVRLNGEIVEPHMKDGYLGIAHFAIHRAVAELFIPNPEHKPCVDHINTIKTDNRAENLEWVTSSENQKRRHALGNIKTSHRKVGRFDLDGNLIEEFESILSAAEKMGVKRNAIDCVLQGRHKTSCGSFWKYLD